MSMWDYAVARVREALANEGRAGAERVAGIWERNVNFDATKLLAEAST